LSRGPGLSRAITDLTTSAPNVNLLGGLSIGLGTEFPSHSVSVVWLKIIVQGNGFFRYDGPGRKVEIAFIYLDEPKMAGRLIPVSA
jgi:hypothetical protein